MSALPSGARAGRVAAVACALATFLAFPQRVGPLSFDLGLLFAWAVPALLLTALRDLSPARALLRAFLVGWLGHALVLHWFYVVVHVHGHAPWWLGALAPLGAALYIGAIVGAFGWVWAQAARFGAQGPWLFAALWVLADYVRTHLFGGFPWAVLAYAQHENPLLMALAPLVGIWGIGFVTALLGAWLADLVAAVRAGRRPTGRDAVTPLAALAICLCAYGYTLAAPGETRGSVRVAALQGNVLQGEKWNRARFDETLDRYDALTRRAVAAGAELVVWPETAVPGPLELEADAQARVARLAQETGATLVVGSVGITRGAGGRGIEAFFDSAFVFSPGTPRTLRYDKTHLVPFGEYMPLRWLIGSVVGSVARGAAPLDVTPGAEPRALDLVMGRGAPAPDEAPPIVRVGVPICYELVFPDLVRRFTLDGARVLLAITNDAWYGRTGAPDQFLAMTAMRSAENRVWTVRAANTGVSAIIDTRGRVRQHTAIFERDMIVADVPLLPPEAGSAAKGSIYVRFGDGFVALCAAIVGVGFMGGLRRTREREGASA